MLSRLLIIFIIGFITWSPGFAEENISPYGSSKFIMLNGVKNIEQLKVVFDFNFYEPHGIKRALHPISYMLKTVSEFGPVSFEPVDIIVVSHGSEVVAFAKQNYQEYKDIVDRASRLAKLGVKFEVCSVAAGALGFSPDDFHGFVHVVPTGSYALVYHQNEGYALMPGASTVPGDLINPNNRSFIKTKSNQ